MRAECKDPDCQNMAQRRGLCMKHYRLELANGVPLKRKEQVRSPEYYRIRRASKRHKAIAEGTFGVGKGTRKPQFGRVPMDDWDEIPKDVFARGKILAQMMRTPPCLWPAEWTEDL